MPVAAAPEPSSRDIVELIGQHTTLMPDGPGDLRGTCPFCRSTAFHVRAQQKTFHCFACGEGGDAGKFARLIGR
ncbi:MAG: CHC2 zinc finger domain-containing protein [Pseudonocardiaceae bacterium]